MEVCRLCNISKPQRDLTSLDDSTREITKKLREAFSIQLTTSHNPAHNFCCRTCVKKLDTSHEFYQQVVENQKKFEGLNFDPFITIVKSEAEEVIDEDYGDYDETYDDDDGDEDWCEEGTSSCFKTEKVSSESQKSTAKGKF